MAVPLKSQLKPQRTQKPKSAAVQGRTAKGEESGKNAGNPKNTSRPNAGTVRLQRVLASAGCGSRRACEELIVAGRVMVDGEIVTTLGIKVDPNKQSIQLDGRKLKPEKKVYFAVNKPQGYLCTNSDPNGRSRVIDLLPHISERLFTVGRLDENSQGLIVVTNDGVFAQRLAHPSFEVRKVYRVLVAGNPKREELQSLTTGHQFHEGTFKVDSVREIKAVGQATLLEIVLMEGKNREIRRLLARIGHKVMRLQRVELGPLRLGALKLGACRALTRDEVQRLRHADQHTSEEGPDRKESRPGDRRTNRPSSEKRPSGRKQPGKRSGGSRPTTPKNSTGVPARTGGKRRR